MSWLGFLLKYHLHGILCDDMGLGKTLQTIAVVASDAVNRRRSFAETGQDKWRPLPSLVVCPATLVQHWCHEVERFCGAQLKAVAYGGSGQQRDAVIEGLRVGDHVLVVSYEALRSDVERFLRAEVTWNLAILDEGHMVKNPRSKMSMAVKQVAQAARLRLILTGTPIQNNVLELWGLFDFLMPSFLGSEAAFNKAYSKPILASGRDLRLDRQRLSSTARARKTPPSAAALAHGVADILSSEEAQREAQVLEAGDIALDRLHRQVHCRW